MVEVEERFIRGAIPVPEGAYNRGWWRMFLPIVLPHIVPLWLSQIYIVGLSWMPLSWWIWKVAEFSCLNQSTLNTNCCFISKWRINITYAEWNTEEKSLSAQWSWNKWMILTKTWGEKHFLRLGQTKPSTYQIRDVHKIRPEKITDSWGLCTTGGKVGGRRVYGMILGGII